MTPLFSPKSRAVDVCCFHRSCMDSGVPWEVLARDSVLLKAVSHWRQDDDVWLEGSFDRLSETVRVNPLRDDSNWTEGWLEENGAVRIPWFTGPCSAWTLPFERGAAEGDSREMLKALHQTGRLTRQEAVSMLPVIALDPEPGDIVLDMCASPGSKTTHIAEYLGESGLVLANEVVNSRVNMLVSNSNRHGSPCIAVVNHDGRHMPMVPESGFDRVLVDAPCTGSGTTRKNPDVWSKWLPSGGRSLHDLQIQLLSRAVAITKASGRIVYATCSLDPVENEAVIAEILRKHDGIDLLDASELLAGVPGEAGRSDWPMLGDDGRPTDESFPVSMVPPTEERISLALPRCIRIWNDKVDAGGFFLAVLEKTANAVSKKKNAEHTIRPDDARPDPSNSPRPLSEELSETLRKQWGELPNGLWIRGKRVLLSTQEAREVWESDRSRKGGRVRIPGERWRPLRVMHLGQKAALLRKGAFDRIVAGAARRLGPELTGVTTEVNPELIDELLTNGEAMIPDSGFNESAGGRILIDTESGDCIPVWIGSRLSLMLGEPECRILCMQRGLQYHSAEEE